GIASDAGAKAGATQRVGRPARLPGRQKIARARPEAGPFIVIAAFGRAQENPVADQAKRVRPREKQTGKGLALRSHYLGQRLRSAGEARLDALEILEPADRPQCRDSRRGTPPLRNDTGD